MIVPWCDLTPSRDDLDAVDRAARSGRLIGGPEVEAFEREWAERVGTRWCVLGQSGTQVLGTMLRGFRVEPRPPASVVLEALDRAGVSYGGGGVRLVVHLDGIPREMPPGGTFFEDCCQAHGATIQGRPVGSFGRAAAWSFYPTKILGALGDAGAVTTDDEGVAERCAADLRCDAVQAAVLRARLPRLDGWVARRREIASRYAEAFVGFPDTPGEPSWWRFPLPYDRALHRRLVYAGVQALLRDGALCLPCGPHLTDEQVEWVIEVATR